MSLPRAMDRHDTRPTEDPTSSVALALTTLFDENFDAVFAFCLLRSGSRSTAEEIASDVFADAVRTLSSDDTIVLHRGWLFTAARRRLIDHWRRNERERRRIERAALERRHESWPPTEVDTETVLTALDSLSSRQRLALVLRYLDELSVTEVADVMDMTYRAAESLLARARRAFARSYESQRTSEEERP